MYQNVRVLCVCVWYSGPLRQNATRLILKGVKWQNGGSFFSSGIKDSRLYMKKDEIYAKYHEFMSFLLNTRQASLPGMNQGEVLAGVSSVVPWSFNMISI